MRRLYIPCKIKVETIRTEEVRRLSDDLSRNT
nr:MAG TPA: hypothetical protein [Caudoviricetes sp.]